MKSNKKVRQRESFNILLSNWDRVKELTEESANAAGTADEKYEAYMDSMEAATKRLQNAWEGFTQSLETSTVMKSITNATAFLVENADKLKYLITVIAAASSAKIFDFFTSKGETGGFKGLVANIPFIGRGTKTNNILESIDRKVGIIQGEVQKDKSGITKSGGLFGRLRAEFSEYGRTKRAAKGEFGVEVYDLADSMARNAGFNPDLMSDAEYKQYLSLAAKNKQREAQEALAKSWKQRKTAFAQTAAVSGVTTAATQLMTTKQVSGYGQTVEETGGDKALRTGLATAGSVAGAASALIPVVGPMIAPIVSSLGSIAGEGLAGLVSKWFHKDELQMKQRVSEAKENLSALNEIQTTLEGNDNILTKDEYESSDYAKLETVADSLRKTLTENDDLAKAFLEDINKAGIGTYNILEEVYYQITQGNAEINKQLQKQLILTSQRLKIENLYASYEKERAEIDKYVKSAKTGRFVKDSTNNANQSEFGYSAATGQYYLKDDALIRQAMKAGYVSSITNERMAPGSRKQLEVNFAGEDVYEQLENVKKTLEMFRLAGESYGDSTKNLEKIVAKYTRLANQQSKIENDLLEARTQYAYSMADITETYTRSQIREMGREGVIREIAKELSAQGVDILDEQGIMHKDAYDMINKFIKADELLSRYLEQDVRSIGELISTKNQQGIEDFARAFGITAEEAEKLGEKFGYLTQSMGLMNVEEVTEYYEKLGNVFSELGSTAALSATQINKMLSDSNLQDLLPYLMNQDDPDALIKELYKRIYGGGQDFHMENALYDATMNMSTEGFRDFLQNQGAKELVAELDNTSYTTLSQIREAVYELDKSNPRRQKFLEYLETINYTYAKDLTALEKPSEYIKSQLESQISNLQEQKDALSQINDEREKELNLIKARQALEDARKEKRRVYRSGVGFVMESNEEAIAEAQKNLESLNIERQQEGIQAQIDALQLQKDILEALPNQAELEQTKKIWELWAADKNVDGSLASVSESVSMMADAYSNATTTMNMAAKTLDWFGKPNKTDNDGNLSSERTGMTADLTKDEIKAQNASLGNLDENVFGIAEKLGVENAVEPKKSGESKSADKNAGGTKAFKGGKTFINELGTEAVITPGGTLTALPSKTGIVPADITRNVWALGEVAPTLVARLSSLNQKAFAGNAGNTTYEEGQYIDNLTMNVYPTKDYDMDKLLSEARSKARLTRHSN